METMSSDTVRVTVMMTPGLGMRQARTRRRWTLPPGVTRTGTNQAHWLLLLGAGKMSWLSHATSRSSYLEEMAWSVHVIVGDGSSRVFLVITFAIRASKQEDDEDNTGRPAINGSTNTPRCVLQG